MLPSSAKAGLAFTALVLSSGLASAQFFADDFESYSAPGGLEGLGGWEGWDGVNTTSTQVSTMFANSGTKSIEVAAGADTIRQFAGVDAGVWTLSAMQYIPSGGQGVSYFIVMNDYNHSGPYEWSIQIGFNHGTGNLQCDCGSTTQVIQPFITDQWVELRAEIDLDLDFVEIYYDNVLLAGYLWSSGTFGQGSYPVRAIEAIDLYPDTPGNPNVSSIWYDDIVLDGSITAGSNYCNTAMNSTGAGAVITGIGTPNIANNDLVLSAEPCPPGEPGLFYYGPDQIQVPFGNGIRCVGGAAGSIARLFPFAVADAQGVLSYAVDYSSAPANGPITAGSTYNFQAWFRDPAGGGSGFNLSDGLEVNFIP
jgi:hypothetical protein